MVFFITVGIFFVFIEKTQQIASQINKNGNRYPSYSLQNMPKTDFSCRGKILGGYYADADTQCQMFHICVKVAGVGVGHEKFWFFFYFPSKSIILFYIDFLIWLYQKYSIKNQEVGFFKTIYSQLSDLSILPSLKKGH